MTRSTDRPPLRPRPTGATGAKLLISAVALAATVSGWALLADSDGEAIAQTAQVSSGTAVGGVPRAAANRQPTIEVSPSRSAAPRVVTAPRTVTRPRPPVAVTRSSR